MNRNPCSGLFPKRLQNGFSSAVALNDDIGSAGTQKRMGLIQKLAFQGENPGNSLGQP